MSFWDGVGKIVLGVGCVVAAPLAASAVGSLAAATGAVAVVTGITTEAVVVSHAVLAMGVAEGAVCSKGVMLINERVNSCENNCE